MAVLRKRSSEGLIWVAATLCFGIGATTGAQQTPKVPATDASTQASPATASSQRGKDVDGSAQASPEVGPLPKHGGPALATLTTLAITLSRAIDSGRLRNGDHVAATLSHAAGRYPAGTPTVLSVIATVPAGRLSAAGEFSLQLMSVGRSAVYTETQTFRGQPGHKDLPDSAPALGTDAGLPVGAPLTYHVQPPPTAATGAPRSAALTPGSVSGRASGDAPPQDTTGANGESANSGSASSGSASSGSANKNAPNSGSGQQQTVTPANTTSAGSQGTSPSSLHPVPQIR